MRFCTAAEVGDVETVQLLLLEQRTLAHSCTKEGRSALCLAAGNGHAAAVKLLLDAGDLSPSLSLPFFHSFSYSLARLLILLLSHWITPHSHSLFSYTLLTPPSLLFAGMPGANVNRTELRNGGLSPLLAASAGGHAEAVKVLLAAGADVSKTDKSLRTPLYAASCAKHPEVMRLLLEHGAELTASISNVVNSRTSMGETGIDTEIIMMFEDVVAGKGKSRTLACLCIIIKYYSHKPRHAHAYQQPKLTITFAQLCHLWCFGVANLWETT